MADGVHVVERPDGNAEARRCRRRHILGVAVIAHGDGRHDALLKSRIDRTGVGIGAIRILGAAQAEVEDANVVSVLVRDGPLDAIRRPEPCTGIRQDLLINESGIGRHATEQLGVATGAQCRSRDMRAMVAGRFLTVVDGVHRLVHARVQLRLTQEELATRHETAHQGFVPRIAARLKGVVIDARVENAHHDPLTRQAQLIPDGRKHFAVHRLGTTGDRGHIVDRVVHRYGFDAGNARQRRHRLNLGEGQFHAHVIDVAVGVEHRQVDSRISDGLQVRRRRSAVIPHVHAIAQRPVRVGANRKLQTPQDGTAVFVGLREPFNVDPLNAVINAIAVRVPHPRDGHR